MSIWKSVARWLSPSATLVDKTFSLGDRGDKPAVEEQGAALLSDAQLRTESVLARIDQLLDATPQGVKAIEQAGDLSTDLTENLKRLERLFRLPENKDLVIRELTIATQPPTPAAVLFMEGLTDKQTINDSILQPLMLLSHLDHHVAQQGEHGPSQFTVEMVKRRLLPGHQVSDKRDATEIADALLAGDTVLLFEGTRTALAVETKGFPVRSVGETKAEHVIWGPHDAFTEAFRVNIALVRRRLKDPRVVTEILTVGEVSKTFVGIMYVDTIVQPKLVAEVKRRVEAVKVDTLGAAGILEQYIEDSPKALFPSCLLTERPDRTAAYLAEGHVALLVDNSPQAIICPTVFWSLLQTSEDYYLRWPFGSMLRYIRLAALLIALLVPAVYIAVVNYHQEMIPTELMLFIAASREQVPMPAVLELILMDIAFELIREAGTRIPSVIGPTIGLVASLILGQAAVEAKIVSPIMILVIAITGLASFAIPNLVVGYGVRVFRFFLLALTTVLGFYGIAAGIYFIVVLLAARRSFGVPYLSPLAPFRGRGADIFTRSPLFHLEERPPYLNPLQKRRQKEIIRTWDPFAPKSETEQKEG